MCVCVCVCVCVVYPTTIHIPALPEHHPPRALWTLTDKRTNACVHPTNLDGSGRRRFDIHSSGESVVTLRSGRFPVQDSALSFSASDSEGPRQTSWRVCLRCRRLGKDHDRLLCSHHAFPPAHTRTRTQGPEDCTHNTTWKPATPLSLSLSHSLARFSNRLSLSDDPCSGALFQSGGGGGAGGRGGTRGKAGEGGVSNCETAGGGVDGMGGERKTEENSRRRSVNIIYDADERAGMRLPLSVLVAQHDAVPRFPVPECV